MNYKIIKGQPLPVSRSARIKSLKVKDCLIFPVEEIGAFRQCVKYQRKAGSKSVYTVKIYENEQGIIQRVK